MYSDFLFGSVEHLIQVSFNSLQWVILGQTPTGVEPNEGALRLLQMVSDDYYGKYLYSFSLKKTFNIESICCYAFVWVTLLDQQKRKLSFETV